SAIKAFDALQGAPAPRRRRNPWAAVAAAAGLRGFWQNKPDSGRARNPWRAVAAAARLGGFWQNKPDFAQTPRRLARLNAKSRTTPRPSAAQTSEFRVQPGREDVHRPAVGVEGRVRDELIVERHPGGVEQRVGVIALQDALGPVVERAVADQRPEA